MAAPSTAEPRAVRAQKDSLNEITVRRGAAAAHADRNWFWNQSGKDAKRRRITRLNFWLLPRIADPFMLRPSQAPHLTKVGRLCVRSPLLRAPD
jgi:hypothetical protein